MESDSKQQRPLCLQALLYGRCMRLLLYCQTQYHDAVFIVVVDFNSANSLKCSVPSFSSTSPAPSEVRGHWTTVALSLRTAVRHNHIQCLENCTMPLSSPCLHINKGWSRKLQFKGRLKAWSETSLLYYLTHWTHYSLHAVPTTLLKTRLNLTFLSPESPGQQKRGIR